jgi:hypothetical protein
VSVFKGKNVSVTFNGQTFDGSFHNKGTPVVDEVVQSGRASIWLHMEAFLLEMCQKLNGQAISPRMLQEVTFICNQELEDVRRTFPALCQYPGWGIQVMHIPSAQEGNLCIVARDPVGLLHAIPELVIEGTQTVEVPDQNLSTPAPHYVPFDSGMSFDQRAVFDAIADIRVVTEEARHEAAKRSVVYGENAPQMAWDDLDATGERPRRRKV